MWNKLPRIEIVRILEWLLFLFHANHGDKILVHGSNHKFDPNWTRQKWQLDETLAISLHSRREKHLLSFHPCRIIAFGCFTACKSGFRLFDRSNLGICRIHWWLDPYHVSPLSYASFDTTRGGICISEMKAWNIGAGIRTTWELELRYLYTW